MMEHASHPPCRTPPPPNPSLHCRRRLVWGHRVPRSKLHVAADKVGRPEDGDNGEEEKEEDVGGKEEEGGGGGNDSGTEGKRGTGGQRGKWQEGEMTGWQRNKSTGDVVRKMRYCLGGNKGGADTKGEGEKERKRGKKWVKTEGAMGVFQRGEGGGVEVHNEIVM